MFSLARQTKLHVSPFLERLASPLVRNTQVLSDLGVSSSFQCSFVSLFVASPSVLTSGCKSSVSSLVILQDEYLEVNRSLILDRSEMDKGKPGIKRIFCFVK